MPPAWHPTAARAVVLGLAASLTIAGGCTPIRTHVAPAEPRPAAGVLLAGAARVDITPPPGYPMGGHAFAGTESRGAWGRLHARALVLEDPRGEVFALVVADLWAVSAGLQEAALERLQRDHGLGNFDRGSLILAATHTHQSPAAFASDYAHNFAAAEHPSYDRRLFDALAGALAGAIAEAYAGRRAARVEVADAVIPGLARNRSLPAFRRDPEAPSWIAGARAPGACAGPTGTEADACRAIDPGAFALRLHARDGGALIGAAIFVALHPTAMPNTTPVYQSDVFGVAAARLEAELGGEAPGGPVIAIVNGAEGDVSPAWRAQGLGEALRLAALLGDGARYLVTAPPRPLAVEAIRERHGVFALADRRFEDPAGGRRRTARRAALGWVALGGAEDGPTGARVPPEGSPRPRPRADGHGLKRVVLPIGGRTLAPEAPLAVIRLGGHALVSLPGEVTTILGARIRRAVAAAADLRPADVHLVGLAGAYRSYFTTPEEYDAQHYEGASSLYGRDAGMLLVADLACLAAPRGRCDLLPVSEDRTFRPGPGSAIPLVDRRRGRRWLDRGGDRVDALFRRPGVAPVDLRFAGPALAGRVALGDAIWPEVQVELATAGGWAPWVGPRGRESASLHRLVLRVAALAGERVIWEARWIDPSALPEGARARLRVTLGGRTLACSPPLERAQLVGAAGPGRVDAVDCDP